MRDRSFDDDRRVAVEYRPIAARIAHSRTPADQKSGPGLGRQIALLELAHAATLESLARWVHSRGACRFPSRERFVSAGLGGFIRHTAIVRLIEGAADYEFRVAGAAYQEALGITLTGKRLYTIAETLPHFARGIRRMFEQVRRHGAPVAMRGSFEAENANATHLAHESVFLPLGRKKTFVDHVLHVGVYERVHRRDETTPPPGRQAVSVAE